MKEFRLFGPPGTGKTTYLGRQINEVYLRQDGYPPSSIYVSSFTKAAAKEILSRNEFIPEQNVGTLHALCFRLLDRPRIAETKTREFDEWVNDKSFQFDSNISVDMDNPLEEKLEIKNRANGSQYLAEINLRRNQLIHESEWEIGYQRFYKKWREWKEETGYVDFTDLLEYAADNELRLPNLQVFIVDEAQDMTPLHWKLARMWGESAEKFLVAGDDDQAIYDWAGAKVEKFLEGSTEENSKVLTQSHRIPRAVHELSQAWIKNVIRRKAKEFKPLDERGSVHFGKSTFRDLLDSFEDYVSSCVERSETVMVLASANQFLQPVLDKLRNIGVPFHNIYRRNNGAWNPLSRRSKTIHSADRLASFLSHPRTVSDVGLWAECIYKKLYDTSIIEGMKLHPKDTEVLDEDFDPIFGDLSESFATDDVDALERALLAKYASGFEYPLSIFRRRRMREDLISQPLVTVGTIHSVKGGEADHVIVIPDLPAPAYADWIRGNRDSIYRLFYVAFTRARKSLTILSPASSRAIPVPYA